MGLRSRLGNGLVRVGKTFGGSVPAAMLAGEEASQMTPASPFSPGTPVGPYDGFDRHPRAHDFTTGYNIATRPRTHERVSFETLTGLVEAYDIAQLAIWHRIDSIRSLEWKLIADDSYNGDVTDAIDVGMAALRKPDRINSFETWLAKWLYDVLAFDAGCLYRLRNRGGRCVGLSVVDGRTIAPLLDYWGNSPTAVKPGDPEPEAYVQYVNGLPWNWLTRSDLIYEPFRPVPNSPYGRAPLEAIILNANTDIRFQLYFLERFTAGNLPAAFASSPDSWSPDQIEQFQAYWDSFMYADQSQKHQIKWMPPGSKFEWSNEKEFSDQFSLFMMRKSLAAYHVVPADMGFTENVNRSSGESQADVQHRIGDLPLIRFVHRVVTHFLKDDLRLPLRFTFDLGEEQDDRLATAQSDDIYIKNGTISPSDIREMRFGKPEPGGRPVPRFIFSNRAGPIPLSSLEDVAGPVDGATGAPGPGAVLPHKEFLPVEGVVPVPPPPRPALAVQEYGQGALPPAPASVAKEGETAGITSETGLTSYDLIRGDDEPDEAEVAKEMAAFRRFERARRRSGEWRDFEFRAVDPVTGRGLNEAGRAEVIKAGGAAPKALGVNRDGPEARHWPGWDLDLKAVEHWAPLLAAALAAALTKAQAEKIARDWIAAHPAGQQDTQGRREAVAAAVAWLTAQGVNLTPAIAPLIPGMTADAHLIGGVSAAAVTGGTPPDLGGWQPGAEDKAGDRVEALGLAAGLSAALARAGQTAQQAADGYMTYLGRTLADGLADGLDAAGLADRLTGTLADLAGAGAAVLDVISAGIGMAARAWYRLTEVQQLNFITALDERVCPRCEQCEAGSPYSASDAPEIPQHPRCRCALVPADD